MKLAWGSTHGNTHGNEEKNKRMERTHIHKTKHRKHETEIRSLIVIH